MTQPFIKSLAAIAAIILICLTTSCDTILQYPDREDIDPDHSERKVLVDLTADVSFEMLGEFEYDFENPTNTLAGMSRASEPSHQLRITLKAFDLYDKAQHSLPIATVVTTAPASSSINRVVEIGLHPGDYHLMAWVDHVDVGSEDDKYYNTADFSEITLNNDEGHHGSNEYRDAFYGEATLHVGTQEGGPSHTHIKLKRPMAKYTFISNDLHDFLDKEGARVQRTPQTADSPFHAPPLTDYSVRVVYTRYMPSSFNLYTGKPADSRPGVEYGSQISIVDDNNAQLAFDYVFTNGTETSVSVAMEVVHRDGTVVGRMPQFDIPLRRSHHTIIIGKFLTTKSGGNLGINPEFDGEFNIIIK